MIPSIIGLILFIIIAVVIFKLVKSVVKAILLISSLAVLIIVILGFLIAADANDFKEKFPTQPSLYVLEDNGKLLAANSMLMGDNPVPDSVNDNELSALQASFEKGDFTSMMGSNYKMFIIPIETLEGVEKIQGEGVELSGQQVINLLRSNAPISDFIKLQFKEQSAANLEMFKQQLKQQMKIETDTEFKGILFINLYSSAIAKNGPIFLFEEYKKGNIVIYPETALFKVIKLIPLSIIEKIVALQAQGE